MKNGKTVTGELQQGFKAPFRGQHSSHRLWRWLLTDFETLDLFGPVEVFGKVDNCSIKYFSINSRNIINKDNVQIVTENIDKIEKYDVLLVPGGIGTRMLVNDDEFINKLKIIAEKSSWCLTVCTGSALFAKIGLLDKHEATSNKMAFEWVKVLEKM